MHQTPKVCKTQNMTTSRLHPVLDMRPTTTNKTTNNRAALITAHSITTLLPGLFRFHPYHMKDLNQAQTLNGMWHLHLIRRSYAPKLDDLP